MAFKSREQNGGGVTFLGIVSQLTTFSPNSSLAMPQLSASLNIFKVSSGYDLVPISFLGIASRYRHTSSNRHRCARGIYSNSGYDRTADPDRCVVAAGDPQSAAFATH